MPYLIPIFHFSFNDNKCWNPELKEHVEKESKLPQLTVTSKDKWVKEQQNPLKKTLLLSEIREASFPLFLSQWGHFWQVLHLWFAVYVTKERITILRLSKQKLTFNHFLQGFQVSTDFRLQIN